MTGESELPPDTVFSDPISVISSPSEPALAIPYIGLCGLLPVSLSERAGITAPLMLAAAAGDIRVIMPLKKALSEWNARPKV